MNIISPQLGVSPIATTGGESYDRELLKQFVKLGLTVQVLLPRNVLYPKELKASVHMTFFSHFIPPYTFNFFSYPWTLRRVFNSKNKDQIIRIHSPEYLFPTGYMIKKMFPSIPLVAHYHLDQNGRIWTETNRILLNLADAVIADSAYLKNQLVHRVRVNKRKIHVVHCGVDIDAIRPQTHKGRTLAHTMVRPYKTILFLGRFIERKRPGFALKIFSELHKRHPLTKFVMIGEGPMEKQLRLQAVGYRLQDFVEFPGLLFGKEKLKRYHEADLFLFPSQHEGFVLVVLEAMAAGLPLLVPDTLGFPEAVRDGENGFLVKGAISSWVASAEKILYDTLFSNSMRKNSRIIAVRQFSWERCAKKNIEVYQQVLKEKE